MVVNLIYVAGLILVVAMLLLLHLRNKWYPRFKQLLRHNLFICYSDQAYEPLSYNDELFGRSSDLENGEAGLFRDDVSTGLNSETFNVWQQNVMKGTDDRKGLDTEAKKRIVQIMNQDGVSFDEARLKYMKSKMGENGISPDGLPNDSRLVTFDNFGTGH